MTDLTKQKCSSNVKKLHIAKETPKSKLAPKPQKIVRRSIEESGRDTIKRFRASIEILSKI